MQIKKTFRKKIRKKSKTLSLIKFNLQKSLDKTPLYYELLNNGAFRGDYYKHVHFSQENFIIGYKNKVSFYNITTSISLFNNALRFLKTAKKKKNQNFVFVGNPPQIKIDSKYVLQGIKLTFFGQDVWKPGFFSKNPSHCSSILVIYDITTNYTAFREAVSMKVPVVGFVTPKCDVRGVDYPVVLNLENAGLIYLKLCKLLINK